MVGDEDGVYSVEGRLRGDIAAAASTLRRRAAGDRHALAGFSPSTLRPSLTGEACDGVFILTGLSTVCTRVIQERERERERTIGLFEVCVL